MKCKQCGKNLKSGLTKCPSCDTYIEEAVSLGAISATEEKKAKKAKKKAKKKLSGTDLALRISLITISILAVLAILFGILYIYARSMIKENAHIDEKFTEDEKKELHINTELPTAAEGILNIALFGLDERGETGDTVDAAGHGKSFHSDAIIILTIDRRNKKTPAIKMTSIARDTLVHVEGYNSKESKTKLTHAFDYGYRKAKNADTANRDKIRKEYKGKELEQQLAQLEANYKRAGAKTAIATINQNFNLNIEEYMYVNFVEFMDIIDYVGGVTINVEQRELNELNKHVRAMEKECGRDLDTVSKAGKQTLTGGQALAYSRIRKIDSDLKRANRQKDVLQSLFDKVKDTPINKLPDVIGQMLSMCHTTLTAEQILELGTWAVTNGPGIDNYTMPPENADGVWVWGGTHVNYGWVWIYDLDYASSLMIDFIFSDVVSEGLPKPTITTPSTLPTQTTTTSQTTTTTETTVSTGVSTSTVTGTDVDGSTTLPTAPTATSDWPNLTMGSDDPSMSTLPTLPTLSTESTDATLPTSMTRPSWATQTGNGATNEVDPTGGTASGIPGETDSSLNTDATSDATDVVAPTDPTTPWPTVTNEPTETPSTITRPTGTLVTDPTAPTVTENPTWTESTTTMTDPTIIPTQSEEPTQAPTETPTEVTDALETDPTAVLP